MTRTGRHDLIRQAAERDGAVLDVIARGYPFTGEIIRETGMTRFRVRAALASLVTRGMIQRARWGRYRLVPMRMAAK